VKSYFWVKLVLILSNLLKDDKCNKKKGNCNLLRAARIVNIYDYSAL